MISVQPCKGLIGDVWTYIRSYRKNFVVGTLLATVASLFWLVIPWATGEIISFASRFEPNQSTVEAWYLLGVIAISALFYYLGQEIARYLIYNVAEKSSVDLQLHTLSHVVHLDLHWHEDQSGGKKLKRISRGGTSLNSLVRMYVDHAIDSVVGLAGITIVFFALSWKLNLILIVFFITHYLLSARMTLAAQEQSRKVNAMEDTFYGQQFELLNSVVTLKTMNLGDALFGNIRQFSLTLLEGLRYRIFLFRTRLAALGLHQQLFRLAIIGFSVWEVIKGNFAVGMIAQVFFYFGKIETVATRFSDMYHQYMMAQVDLAGINEILNTKPSVEWSGKTPFPKSWKTLRLQNLHFFYNQKTVLDDISLTIRRGEKIGIAGASGEGKTTLFKIMQGLYEDYSGFVGFDDLSLKEIQRESYVRHIGVVLQETELFNLSIRDNITLGVEPDKESELRLAEAIQIARIDEFARRHSQGLATHIGEKGIRLSGGEKQRLGIARAIYRQPDILFLDEATSHLDNESENRIQDALHQFFKEMTVVVIAHRLSTLREMDRILVLKEGKIAAIGTFEALGREKGIFAELLSQNGN
ncbi:MAG: ABC transporter ATP-binding protein [Bacteroidia bacterium]